MELKNTRVSRERRISIRDALLALAGSWKMSDAEAKRLEKNNRKVWSTWKLSS